MTLDLEALNIDRASKAKGLSGQAYWWSSMPTVQRYPCDLMYHGEGPGALTDGTAVATVSIDLGCDLFK